MKLALLFLAICLAVASVSAIGGNNKGDLNRPKIGPFGKRERRSLADGFKGGVKVHPLYQFRTSTMPSVRKGEYVCGDKICKLKPGVVPKGCNGMCQYPIM